MRVERTTNTKVPSTSRFLVKTALQHCSSSKGSCLVSSPKCLIFSILLFPTKDSIKYKEDQCYRILALQTIQNTIYCASWKMIPRLERRPEVRGLTLSSQRLAMLARWG